MSKINKNLFGDVALELQMNIEAEGEALQKYQGMLNHITEVCNSGYLFRRWNPEKNIEEPTPTAKADEKMFKLIADTIKKYMAEEMKHLKGLQVLYRAITGIKAETDDNIKI